MRIPTSGGINVCLPPASIDILIRCGSHHPPRNDTENRTQSVDLIAKGNRNLWREGVQGFFLLFTRGYGKLKQLKYEKVEIGR